MAVSQAPCVCVPVSVCVWPAVQPCYAAGLCRSLGGSHLLLSPDRRWRLGEVRCIKKPLPSSDLSPSSHIRAHSRTHTSLPANPAPSRHSSPQPDSTLYQTRGREDAWARANVRTHWAKRTHVHTPSSTYSFHHKMAASEKEWGERGAALHRSGDFAF